MALTKVNRGGLNTGISDSSDATAITIDSSEKVGIGQTTPVRRLHIKDGNKIIGGSEAFLYVWKKIPKYKFLYNFFKLPVVFQIFKFAYEIIAYFLYLKNKKQLRN